MALIGQIGRDGQTITPSDTADLPKAAEAIHVSVAGSISIITLEGNQLDAPNVPVGIWDMGALKVFATGTAATGLIAIQTRPF